MWYLHFSKTAFPGTSTFAAIILWGLFLPFALHGQASAGFKAVKKGLQGYHFLGRAGSLAEKHVDDILQVWKKGGTTALNDEIAKIGGTPISKSDLYCRLLAKANYLPSAQADEIFYNLQKTPKLADRLHLWLVHTDTSRIGYAHEVFTANAMKKRGHEIVDMSLQYTLRNPIKDKFGNLVKRGDIDLVTKNRGTTYFWECKGTAEGNFDNLEKRQKLLDQVDKYLRFSDESGANAKVVVATRSALDELTIAQLKRRGCIILEGAFPGENPSPALASERIAEQMKLWEMK